ncbi:hypothetical protein MT349_11570 [Rathayibacter caricis]|uniref:hypothetical protein n=1 Tax=Rathayibacter caricis TaxID=110936 RepID=UPI001FB48EA8|nr:hypothetical protein [Rathayibacter caricis]MCJ1696418.1 hypothetical protein [Rathayibacter caricis]
MLASPLRSCAFAAALLSVAVLTSCTPAPADTVSATSTPSATPSASAALTPDQRARGEALLADAGAILSASAGVVDEERRSVLDAALPPLTSALSAPGPSFDAALAAVVAAREVVAGRVVELAQTALDESGLADPASREVLAAASASLRDALAARAEASPATMAVITAIAPVRASHSAGAEALRVAEEAAAREAAAEAAPTREAAVPTRDEESRPPAEQPADEQPSSEPDYVEFTDIPLLEMPEPPVREPLPTLG